MTDYADKVLLSMLREYRSITVQEACNIISRLGFGTFDIRLQGPCYKTLTLSIDKLKRSRTIYCAKLGLYAPTKILLAKHIQVAWLGGPPMNSRMLYGSLVKCVADFILYDKVLDRVNPCI